MGTVQNPVRYSPEVAKRICDLIANGESLAKASKLSNSGLPLTQSGLPDRSQIHAWMNRESEFAKQYALARELRADFRSDQIDVYKEKMLKAEIPPEVARVAIAAEQWQASKENPRKYGDKTIISGDAENPLQLLAIRLDQAIARKENLIIDVTPSVIDNSDLY